MSDLAALRARFTEVVDGEESLRAATGAAHQRAVDKVIDVLDDHARRFIAAAPFVFIGSAAADGTLDVSPKGDPAGFAHVLDDRTLAIPDRPGNRRYDTYRNLFDNPNIGLIFIVPGVDWTLRVSGKGILVRDPTLRAALAERGKLPDQVLVVAVERVLAHCPKCMIRSGLWNPAAWPDASAVPTLAETITAHARLTEPLESVEAALEAGNRDGLY